MSEAELREGLRAAVGDEPPLRFDPDELIRRGRHERRRRRALVAVMAATLAITGTVLSLPGLLVPRPGTGPPGIDVAAPPVLTTTAAPSPVASTSLPVVSPVDTKFLSEYASQRLVRVVPAVKVVRSEFTDTRGLHRPGYVTGFVQFIDGNGVSGVTIQLSAPPLLVTRDQFCADVACEAPQRLPDGTYLEFATAVAEAGDRLVTYSVAHFRDNGVVVQVSGYNYDPMGGRSVREEVALSREQLVELATDPKFSMW